MFAAKHQNDITHSTICFQHSCFELNFTHQWFRMTLENAVINNGGLKQYASSVVLKSPRKMAAAFALSVVHDSIQRLDSCQQQDDYSSLVLRLEYIEPISFSK